jgi:alkanesulfonate monooxygenase SsuD/methylene tetrahydromethanopterin reductase-like flavin-dependent oxidoreductase (luciferase family)
VRLGTAAISTFPSHPLVTARAARTADAAAPGRVVLGVSSGHRAWIEQEYGLRFERPVGQVTEWVRTVRRLLRGEALTAPDNAFDISAASSGAAAEVPVVVAATGPQMLEAAAGIADGVLTWMSDETYLGEVVLPAVTRGAARAGRPAPPVAAGALLCVCDDAERARAGLRPRLGALGSYDSYRAVLAYRAPAPREPADVAIVGTEADGRLAFGRLAAEGVSEVVAVVLPDPADPPGSVQRARRLLAALASGRGPHPPAASRQAPEETHG